MRLMAGRSRAVSVCSFTFTAPHCGGREGLSIEHDCNSNVAEEQKIVGVLRSKETVGYRRMRWAMPSGTRPTTDVQVLEIRNRHGARVSNADHARLDWDKRPPPLPCLTSSAPHV